MRLFKDYNLADWFSFYRIAAAPVLVVILLLGHRELFSWLLLVSFSTDAIDGFLARRFNMMSPRGSQLDSLGDQITLILGVLGLLSFNHQFMMENLVLIFIAFIPYGIQMLIAFIKYGRATAFHTYLAKASAIVQAVFILWALFFSPVYPLFYFMLVLGIFETVEEVMLIYMHPEWRSDIKGIYWVLKNRKHRSGVNK